MSDVDEKARSIYKRNSKVKIDRQWHFKKHSHFFYLNDDFKIFTAHFSPKLLCLREYNISFKCPHKDIFLALFPNELMNQVMSGGKTHTDVIVSLSRILQTVHLHLLSILHLKSIFMPLKLFPECN